MPAAPALKNIFDRARYRHIAAETAAVYPRFDEQEISRARAARPGRTLADAAPAPHQRMPARHAAGRLQKAIAILRKLAPRINSGFVTLVLPDYVGLYGRDDFDTSMEALKFLPPSAARSSPSASSSARTRRARWP
jgi:hypothetical protein